MEEAKAEQPDRATILAAAVLFQTIPSTLLHFGHPLSELAAPVREAYCSASRLEDPFDRSGPSFSTRPWAWALTASSCSRARAPLMEATGLVLVHGASGFIGAHLCAALAARAIGPRPSIAAKRRPRAPRVERKLRRGVELFQGRLRGLGESREALRE